MKRTIILAIVMSLLLAILPVGLAFAATSADVTVTATPSYIAITNAPITWTINDLGTGSESGKGVIEPDTIYYANPTNDADDTVAPSSTVLDAECYFTITNTSSVPIDITVTWGDFTGGGADMTNSDTDGSNGTTTYGAFSWFSGDAYPGDKVVIKSTGSAVGKSALSAGSIKWGCEIETRTDVWSSGTSSTTGVGEYLTITATSS